MSRLAIFRILPRNGFFFVAFMLLLFSCPRADAWWSDIVKDPCRSPSLCFAKELARISLDLYPDESANLAFSSLPSEEIDVFEFEDFVFSFDSGDESLSDEDKAFLVSEYSYHAELARRGIKSSFEVPEEMRSEAKEFMLYLDGCADLKERSGSAEIPNAWKELLLLPEKMRTRRSS